MAVRLGLQDSGACLRGRGRVDRAGGVPRLERAGPRGQPLAALRAELAPFPAHARAEGIRLSPVHGVVTSHHVGLILHGSATCSTRSRTGPPRRPVAPTVRRASPFGALRRASPFGALRAAPAQAPQGHAVVPLRVEHRRHRPGSSLLGLSIAPQVRRDRPHRRPPRCRIRRCEGATLRHRRRTAAWTARSGGGPPWPAPARWSMPGGPGPPVVRVRPPTAATSCRHSTAGRLRLSDRDSRCLLLRLRRRPR